jgi:hypothetical protein
VGESQSRIRSPSGKFTTVAEVESEGSVQPKGSDNRFLKIPRGILTEVDPENETVG